MFVELNDTQEGVLNIAFRVADEQGLLLLDLEDLRALLGFIAENAGTISRQFGNVSQASVASIQRRLLVLEPQGAEEFFGEPALELSDLMRRDLAGRGVINVLAADELIHQPRMYATLLLWLLSELWEELPEVGDPAKPVLVFFFDEAHLLSDTAPRVLLEKVEQVVRLIRCGSTPPFGPGTAPLSSRRLRSASARTTSSPRIVTRSFIFIASSFCDMPLCERAFLIRAPRSSTNSSRSLASSTSLGRPRFSRTSSL